MMKTFVSLAIIAALISTMTTPAMANPLGDVCEIQAKRSSGYSGNRSGLTWSVGQFDFRLSGSFAVGLSHTSGSPTNPNYGPTPPFAGMGALEQREARKKRKYAEAYTSCMQAG